MIENCFMNTPINFDSDIYPDIVRQGYLAEKIVIMDGQPGCGKTMLSPIISGLERVELLTYAFEIEFICRLFHFNKISEDAAIAMVRMLTDHQLYQTMMGRETNFRYSDLSSVFKDSNPWRYFRRIFQRGGEMLIPEQIKKERPILNLTTHDLMAYSHPIFAGLRERVIFIEVVRHPLYMLIQQTLNMERLLKNPRDIQIYIKHGENQLPYMAHNWENLFISSNAVEKTIYTMQKCLNIAQINKSMLQEKYGKQILTIPFEQYVIEPRPYMKLIEEKLDLRMTSKTKKIMIKQNVPRKKIADGIPLNIYKRCGWKPPDNSLTEKEELIKRRQFAIDNGASREAIDVLDKLSYEYEQTTWKPE